MPRNHRVGPDENECFGPVGPDPTNDQPEQAIQSIQLGARLFALVNRQVAVAGRPTPLPNGSAQFGNARKYARIANRPVVITPNANRLCLGSEAVDSRGGSIFDDAQRSRELDRVVPLTLQVEASVSYALGPGL